MRRVGIWLGLLLLGLSGTAWAQTRQALPEGASQPSSIVVKHAQQPIRWGISGGNLFEVTLDTDTLEIYPVDASGNEYRALRAHILCKRGTMKFRVSPNLWYIGESDSTSAWITLSASPDSVLSDYSVPFVIDKFEALGVDGTARCVISLF